MSAYISFSAFQAALSRHPRLVRRLLAGVLILGVAFLGFRHFMPAADKNGQRRGDQPQPVRVAPVTLADVPVYLQGLGTVTPVNTVLVKSRVDGEVASIYFTEGQDVQAGDLLAQIDPRSFEAQLLQARGALARDTALLKNARLDLARYQKLRREDSVTAQQLQAQESLVAQYEGTIQIDAANLAQAELELSYSRIVAPITGRLGLRQVDAGNYIRGSDTKGIVLITQLTPIQVVFSLVEKHLPGVTAAMSAGEPLVVEAWNQDNTRLAATGVLASLDNQIDTSTGTVKAKATFANEDKSLYPNQFVNARLLVSTLRQATVVPTSAIMRGNDGFYVYVVTEPEEAPAGQGKENAVSPGGKKTAGAPPAGQGAGKNATAAPAKQQKIVRVRPVTTGYGAGEKTVITNGLTAGEVVVIDGIDRLKDGAAIQF